VVAGPEARSIFDTKPDEAEEARLDAVADAEVEAGRFVTHDKVAEWLKCWGAPDELPCPKPERR
jgi:predicted transcriptional regulator